MDDLFFSVSTRSNGQGETLLERAVRRQLERLATQSEEGGGSKIGAAARDIDTGRIGRRPSEHRMVNR